MFTNPNILPAIDVIGRKSPFFVDIFARPNGASLGAHYTETTYSISSYRAANSPATSGDELCPNPTLDNTPNPYVGGVAAGWTAYGSGTPAEEVSTVHTPGGSSQKLTRGATNDRVVCAFSTTVGKYYHITAWIYKESGSVFAYAGSTSGNNTLGYSKITPTGEWVKASMTVRAIGITSYFGMWLTTAGSVGYIDDVSIYEITLASTLAKCKTGTTTFSMHSVQSGEGGEIVGQALRWDDALNNGILVYFQPDLKKIYIDSKISGTWANVYNATVGTYDGAGVLRVDQDGTTIKVYYKGTLVTTQVIAITPTNQDWAGLFNGGSVAVHTAFALTEHEETPDLTIFVSGLGSDSNPGSADLPKETLGGANTAVINCEMVNNVVIKAGVYPELITVPRSDLTYTGEGDGTIIDGGSARRGFYSSSKNNVHVRGMKFINCTDYAVYLTTVVGATIRDVTVDGAQVGIRVGGGSGTLLIDNCETSHCELIGIESFYSAGLVISNCYSHTPSGAGCYGYESDGVGTDNNVYNNCWAEGCLCGFIAKLTINCQFNGCVSISNGFGYFQKGSTSTHIEHCVSYQDGVGVYAYDDSGVAPETTNLEVKSTMIDGSTSWGYEITDTGDTGADLDYNCVYNAPTFGKWRGVSYATIGLWRAASSQDANSVTTNPAYTDVTYPDGFHLPAGSALLTAGEGGEPIGIDGA